MKTINRNNSRYRPIFNFNNDYNYVSDDNLTNLIKRVDEICNKYNYDYSEPIYKVIETGTHGIMENAGVRLKSNKTRYTGADSLQLTYYEAKIRKVVAS